MMGTTIRNSLPRPGSDRISIRPRTDSTLARTTSRPTPRPEMSDTNAEVESPDRNTSCMDVVVTQCRRVDALARRLVAHPVHVDAPAIVADGQDDLGSQLHGVQPDGRLARLAGASRSSGVSMPWSTALRTRWTSESVSWWRTPRSSSVSPPRTSQATTFPRLRAMAAYGPAELVGGRRRPAPSGSASSVPAGRSGHGTVSENSGMAAGSTSKRVASMRPIRRWAVADSPTRRTSSSSRSTGTMTTPPVAGWLVARLSAGRPPMSGVRDGVTAGGRLSRRWARIRVRPRPVVDSAGEVAAEASVPAGSAPRVDAGHRLGDEHGQPVDRAEQSVDQFGGDGPTTGAECPRAAPPGCGRPG